MKNKTPGSFSRRDFMRVSVATALSAGSRSLPAFPITAAAGVRQEWRNRQSEMAYRQLGRTGLMISEFVHGGNSVAPDHHQSVEYSMERGLNYLDTAPVYGNGASERGYAKVIKGSKREQVFLTSKVSPFRLHKNELFKAIYDGLPDPEKKRINFAVRTMVEERRLNQPEYLLSPYVGKMPQIEDSFRATVMEAKYGHRFDKRKEYYQVIIDSVHSSLRILGTDYLDIVICPHGATAQEALDIPEIFEAFEKLKQAGKVRFLGVSAHNDPAGILYKAVQTGRYDMAMIAYNVINDEWVAPAIKEAVRKGVGVIGMKVARVVNPGVPGGKAEPHRVEKLHRIIPGDMKVPRKAYLWALQNSDLSAVISEIVDEKMAEENLSLAGRKVELST